MATHADLHSLSGTELDKQVAQALGVEIIFDGDQQQITYIAHPKLPPRQWAPTKFWSQGGPIIEELKIDLNWEWELENTWTASIEPDINTHGKTLLEAAMRAVVVQQKNKNDN